MNQTLTLVVPDRVYKVLWQESQSQKKTVEQLAL